MRAAAVAALTKLPPPPSSPKCCRRRTLQRHSIVNNTAILSVLIAIVMYDCVPRVLSWTLLIPTRRHDTIQNAIFRTFTNFATTDDDNEQTNTPFSKTHEAGSGNDNEVEEMIENDEAEIMDIANALIQASSSSSQSIIIGEEQSSDGDSISNIDVVETFMNKANAAWNDGLSEGNEALGPAGLEANAVAAPTGAEVEDGARTNNYPFFTTLSDTKTVDDASISGGSVGGDEYVNTNSNKSGDLQPLTMTAVDVLKGAIPLPISLVNNAMQAPKGDKNSLLPYSKGVPGSATGTNLTPNTVAAGTIPAQPWKSPFKMVANKGFVQPSSKVTIDSNSSGMSNSPLKGVMIGSAKQSSNMLGPMKKAFAPLYKGGVGAMKTKTGTTTFPLPKMMDGLKKGVGLGVMNSKSSVFLPPPQTLKGTQLSDANAETESLFMKQSITPVESTTKSSKKSTTTPRDGGSLSNKSLLPKIGQINKQLAVGSSKNVAVRGGTLPFMKKSPFTASPSKGFDVSTINAKGPGNYAVTSKGVGGAPVGKGFPPPPLKSPINADASRSPFLKAQMKGVDIGVGKSSNMLGPVKKMSDSRNALRAGEMKAETGTKPFPLPNKDGLKRGVAFGQLKSESTPFPAPLETLKGTQSSSGANVERDSPKLAFTPNEATVIAPGDGGSLSNKSLLPKIGQSNKQVVAGSAKSGGVGGGTLPFMKKSPFTASPSKSVELSSFNSSGKVTFPSQLKSLSPSSSQSLINGDSPRLASDDPTEDTSAPPLKAPLKVSVSGATQFSNMIGKKSFRSSNVRALDYMNLETEAVDGDFIDSAEDADVNVVDAHVDDFEKDEDERNIIAPISFSRTYDLSSVEERNSPSKVMGTGGSFTPKAFTPPTVRPMPKTLDIVDGFIDLDSWKDDNLVSESVRQAKPAKNIWTGESFYGTASSRVYGLGAENIDVKRRSEMKTPSREEKDPAIEQANKEEDVLVNKLRDATKRTVEEMNLIRENESVASFLADAERKIAQQLEKIEQERRETRVVLESAAREKAAAEKRALQLEATLMKDVRFLERRLAGEVASAKLKLKEEQEQWNAERDRLRAVDEARWIDRFQNDEKNGGKVNEDVLLEKFNDLLESKLEARLAELRKINVQAQTATTFRAKSNLPHSSLETDDAVKMQVPNSEPTSLGANNKDYVSDSLATDVKELDIVSMSFDQKQSAHLTSVSSNESAEYPTEYPFVSLLRDSSPYIVNHRHSTIVYHIPGDLISNQARFVSVMDDISLTYLFGMKIVICVGCRKQILQRLENLPGRNSTGVDQYSKVGVRVTDAETLRIVEEEAGFCRFEVERLLNRCLRNKGADCNVVSGCFITAKKYGIIDGADYQVTRVGNARCQV